VFAKRTRIPNSRPDRLYLLRCTRPLPRLTISARKLRGAVLQEELAAYLNVRQGHLSKIERGKIAPSLEILILLSDKFHQDGEDWDYAVIEHLASLFIARLPNQEDPVERAAE
jgi:transcriptional regulator with XRE-family HTH domain